MCANNKSQRDLQLKQSTAWCRRKVIDWSKISNYASGAPTRSRPQVQPFYGHFLRTIEGPQLSYSALVIYLPSMQDWQASAAPPNHVSASRRSRAMNFALTEELSSARRRSGRPENIQFPPASRMFSYMGRRMSMLQPRTGCHCCL